MKVITVILLLAIGVGIMFWWSKRKSEEFKLVSLPGDVGTVSIPADFTTELEDDSTLLAYPPGLECISLRFSSISFTKKDGSENGGIEQVRRKSREKNLPLQEYPEKAAVSYEEESSHDGTPLLIKYWDVGSKNTVLIVSATVILSLRADRRVKRTLELVPEIIQSVSITKLHRVIKSGGKQVEAIVQTVDPVPQTIQQFSGADDKWKIDSLAMAKRLATEHGISNANTPDELDAIFSAWMRKPLPKESSYDIADALGSAFGEYLVSQNGFQWVVVSDEYGTEYAVRHDVGQTMAFPRASVLKRIEDGKECFFQNIYIIICDQLKSACADSQQIPADDGLKAAPDE